MDTLLRLPSVTKTTGLNRANIYRQIKKGLLTRPVQISQRAVAWPESEIAAINAAKIRGASDSEIKELVAALVEARKDAK